MAFVLSNGSKHNLLSLLSLGTRVRLFKNDITPDADTVLVNLTEANFSGYAAESVGVGTPTLVDGKGTNVLNPAAVFVHNSGGTDNDIYGFYLTDSSNTVLYYAERFSDPPIAMNDDGDSITVTVTFTLDQV